MIKLWDLCKRVRLSDRSRYLYWSREVHSTRLTADKQKKLPSRDSNPEPTDSHKLEVCRATFAPDD